LIKNHPQCDRIHLTSEVSDAMSYVRAADLLLLPSLGEVMPLSILEAMVLKTPVLASKVGGISEMIEDGISGSLFDLENSKDFVKKFLLLKKDSSLRKRLAKNAYRRYHSFFSRINHTKRWKTTLDTILNP
jgi:L-malate glycosyltransferase